MIAVVSELQLELISHFNGLDLKNLPDCCDEMDNKEKEGIGWENRRFVVPTIRKVHGQYGGVIEGRSRT